MQDEIIYHHGIKGMKWGVRRYQNEDGSLTPAGKKRYSSNSETSESSAKRSIKAVGAIAATIAVSYAGFKFSTNPKVISAFSKAMEKVSKKSISEASEIANYQVYSKTLGRMLTVEELIDLNLI